MKKKDLNTLRNKKGQKLAKQVSKKKLELAKAFVELKVSEKNNPKKVRILKKDIAQILTVIREKEIAEKEDKTSKSSGGKNK